MAAWAEWAEGCTNPSEKDIALFCRCGAECGCGVSKTNPDHCECGKPLKKINVKGRYKSSGCLCSGLEYTLDL